MFTNKYVLFVDQCVGLMAISLAFAGWTQPIIADVFHPTKTDKWQRFYLLPSSETSRDNHPRDPPLKTYNIHYSYCKLLYTINNNSGCFMYIDYFVRN